MALLSRVAESLFWLGRSVERAENTARLLDVTYHGRLEPTEADIVGATNTWPALISTLGLTTAFDDLYSEADEEQVIEFLTVNERNGSSILSAVTQGRENARGARDFLSSETWVAINRLFHATSHRNVHLIMADGLYDFCDLVRTGAQQVFGTAEATSLHDEGWYWLKSGQLLERADMITRIVDSKYHLLLRSLDEVGGPVDHYHWTAVLRSVSGYEAYRRMHEVGVEPPEVIAFLLLETTFPRSLRASLDALLAAVEQATEGASASARNRPLRTLTGLQTRLRYESVASLLEQGLHEFVRDAQSELANLNQALSESFFWASGRAA